MKYSVIQFEDNSVTVVPSTWLEKATTGEVSVYWPETRIDKKVKKCAEPDKVYWKKHSVVKIFSQSDCLDQAKRRSNRAEETSNVESEDIEHSKRRRKSPIYYRPERTIPAAKKRNTANVSQTYGAEPSPPALAPNCFEDTTMYIHKGANIRQIDVSLMDFLKHAPEKSKKSTNNQPAAVQQEIQSISQQDDEGPPHLQFQEDNQHSTSEISPHISEAEEDVDLGILY